eukprot:9479088-Lingulodinium_polyedra.AAC.1
MARSSLSLASSEAQTLASSECAANASGLAGGSTRRTVQRGIWPLPRLALRPALSAQHRDRR